MGCCVGKKASTRTGDFTHDVKTFEYPVDSRKSPSYPQALKYVLSKDEEKTEESFVCRGPQQLDFSNCTDVSEIEKAFSSIIADQLKSLRQNALNRTKTISIDSLPTHERGRSRKSSPFVQHIAFVGSPNSGKSTLIARMSRGENDDFEEPSRGGNTGTSFTKAAIIIEGGLGDEIDDDGMNFLWPAIRVSLWDMVRVGQSKAMLQMAIESKDCLCLVVSNDDAEAAREAADKLRWILGTATVNLHVIILRNKIDLELGSGVRECLETLRGIARECAVPWYDVSAKTGEGIEAAFHSMCVDVLIQKLAFLNDS